MLIWLRPGPEGDKDAGNDASETSDSGDDFRPGQDFFRSDADGDAIDHERIHQAQQELRFPSASLPHRELIHGQTRTPAGWRKVASKPSVTNAYFKSETSDWNFTLKNGVSRSALSSLPEDERFGIANWAKTQLTVAVKKLALRSELMQAPCPPLKEKGFSPDGSTLPLVVRELRKDLGTFRGWVQHLQTVLPVKEVDVIEREEDKNTYLSVSFEGGLKVPSWHLSDGTLRLMALTLLSYIKTEGSLFLVEEPENGVHPQAVEAVLQSLSSIYDGQALVATHFTKAGPERRGPPKVSCRQPQGSALGSNRRARPSECRMMVWKKIDILPPTPNPGPFPKSLKRRPSH